MTDEHAVKVGAWWYDYRQVACDTAFWQVLGKALGWHFAHAEPCTDGCDGLGENEWELQAHNFYDLILTQQPTEQFWADLLQDKGVV